MDYQMMLGNQAMQRFSQSCPKTLTSPRLCPFGGVCHSCPAKVQAKLRISRYDDEYEREADQVAELVIHKAETSTVRESIINNEVVLPRIQRLCTTCQEELRPQKLKNKEEEEEEEERKKIIQRKETNSQSLEVAPKLESSINGIKGKGSPLSDSEKVFFEPLFGYDLSQVRIHTDIEAESSANKFNAKAYTIGNHIMFGQGHYSPNTREGKRLIAHELTHVVQQGGRIACKPDEYTGTGGAGGGGAEGMGGHRGAGGGTDPYNTSSGANDEDEIINKEEKKTYAETIKESMDSGNYKRTFEILNGQSMSMMLATLSSGIVYTLHIHNNEAVGVNLPRINVAISAVMFGTVPVSLSGWGPLPKDQKASVCNYLEKIRCSKASPPGTADSLKLASGRIWRYVIYKDSVKLHFTPSNTPIFRIGSIPWVTNNPGNLTVDPRKRDMQGRPLPPATKVPWQLPGAVGKSFYKARQKYAIYETYEKGVEAIFPYLQKVHSSRTLESAIRAYVSEAGIVPSCREEQTKKLFPGKSWSELKDIARKSVNNACILKYISTVYSYLAKQVGKEQAVQLMSTKISKIGTKDIQESITAGIMEAEGGDVLQGMIFTCRGFMPPDINAYLSAIAPKLGGDSSVSEGIAQIRTKLIEIITELTGCGIAEEELRKHLACLDKDDACLQ